MPSLRIFSLYIVIISLASCTTSQFVTPYPISDCSGGIGFGYASCPNQEGCCSGGAACCAGGCCPIDAWCVNQGTADEGCCPLSDSDSCGASVASFSKPPCTATGGFNPKPSVQCVSADDDWYCPPGSVCGLSYPQCHDFFELGCESSPPEESPSPTPGPTASESFEGGTTTGSFTGSRPSNAEATTRSPFGGAAAVVDGPGIGVLGAIAAALGLVF